MLVYIPVDYSTTFAITLSKEFNRSIICVKNKCSKTAVVTLGKRNDSF